MSDFELKISGQRVCELKHKGEYVGVVTWSVENTDAATVAMNMIKEAFDMPSTDEMYSKAFNVTGLIMEHLEKSTSYEIESEVQETILKEFLTRRIFAAMTAGLPFQSGEEEKT